MVDLAKGHVKATDFALKNTGAEVFNLGTGKGTSVLDLVKAFERVNGVKVPYKVTPRRPGDIATCYSDPHKAEAVLHWKTEKTVDDMCRDTWRWQTQNPNGFEE